MFPFGERIWECIVLVSLNLAEGSGKNTPFPAIYQSQIIWLHNTKHMPKIVNSLKYNKYILLIKSKQKWKGTDISSSWEKSFETLKHLILSFQE